MRLLADLHVSPRTVTILRSLTYDVVRVDEVMPHAATDRAVVERAIEENRVILTQDLDFPAIIALGGKTTPSLVSSRLSSSRVEYVNTALQKILPTLEADLQQGIIVTVED